MTLLKKVGIRVIVCSLTVRSLEHIALINVTDFVVGQRVGSVNQ